MPRTLAVSKLKKRVHDILAFARHVADSMNGNPDFPSPPSALAKLPGRIAAATRAEAAVLTRAVGTVPRRDARVEEVRTAIEALRVHVQRIADAAPPGEAARIIVSAGFFVHGRIARGRQRLAARPGPVSGSVLLTAEVAGKVAAYHWAYSIDQKTWTEVTHTLKAKTMIASLLPGTRYFFRVRAVRRTGTDDWTAPIAFLVR